MRNKSIKQEDQLIGCYPTKLKEASSGWPQQYSHHYNAKRQCWNFNFFYLVSILQWITQIISWRASIISQNSSMLKKIIVNPFTPKISSITFLTICHTILIILVWRIWYWINQKSPNRHSSLLSSLVCFILNWHCKEKFPLGHSWELKG